MDTATKENESSQQKLLLDEESAAAIAALPAVAPAASKTEHQEGAAVAPAGTKMGPAVAAENNDQSKTNLLLKPPPATTEPTQTENVSQKKPPPLASVSAVAEKNSSSNLKKPPPPAPSVAAAAAVSNVARMPSSSSDHPPLPPQHPDSLPIPDHLERSFHNFATILAIVWPEQFLNDQVAPMAPIILLDFLLECDIIEPVELGIFGEDVLDDDGEVGPTDEELALALWELPCWEDPLDTGRSANARRRCFQAICTFIGNHGEDQFRDFVGNLMDCNYDSTDIILTIHSQNIGTFEKRSIAKDIVTDMKLMGGDNDADLQAALAASLLDQSKLAAKKPRDDDNEEGSQPTCKKQRQTSPTSVDEFPGPTNASTANAADDDSDDGGGKIGAVRDLQKAQQQL